MNFWTKLKKPITILAPMDGVTDIVFRQIVNDIGRPQVFMTEFTAVDALVSPTGRAKALERLTFDKKERPIIAQIWGNNPEHFYQAAKMIKKLGFDGIDINMGCPVRDVVKIGACSALIKNPELAVKIIEATIKGAGGLPVSVKTRIGFNSTDEMESWITTLLSTDIAVLTLHLRTVKEQSKVPAHWEKIIKVAQIRDKLKSKALIIGNGDVKSLSEVEAKVKAYGIDGIMIGRGIFENVWLFNKSIEITKITPSQRVEVFLKHLLLHQKTVKNLKRFQELKKFAKCYISNFPGAAELREKLMVTKSLPELIDQTENLKLELVD